MSWYRKYRPKKTSELAIDSVREVFTAMMQQGKIPQVMLFAGPRGTGKTSSARIISSILNDPKNAAVVDHSFFAGEKPKELKFFEADEKDDLIQSIFSGNSFIVQEMDAASNRGIDDVRALKERLSLPPQAGKMSVYILDEAHMLTKEAFNALLKMLEETPPHVAFILATTELHKIPPTVVSRCSIVHFKKADFKETLTVLKKVCEKENLEAEDEALELIAKVSDGSFRDAIKLLEMAASDGKKIMFAALQEKLSAIGETGVEDLLDALLKKDEAQIAELFSQLRSRSIDEKFLFKSVLEYLHTELTKSFTGKDSKFSGKICHFLLKELTTVDLSTNLPVPLLALELKFLELIFRSKEKGGTGKKSSNSSSPELESLPAQAGTSGDARKQSQIGEVKAKTEISANVAVKKNSETKKASKIDLTTSQFESDSLKPVSKGDGQKLLSAWNNFLGAVEQKQAAIAMLLRSSKPIKAQNGSLSIEVYYPFHKEKLEDMNTKTLLKDCSLGFAGGVVDLEFVLSNKTPSPLGEELETESPPRRGEGTRGEVSNTQSEPKLIELAEELLV